MKIAILTTTFPKNKNDKVPKFIETQVINLKKNYPNLEIYVLCPDNNKNLDIEVNKLYTQIRFQYFYPKLFQTLTNNGIMNQLKNNVLNYFLIPFLFVSQMVSLFKLVKKENIELIYAHWFFPQAVNAYIVSKLCNVPFVFTTHSSDVTIVEKKIPFFGKNIIRKVCKNAVAISAPSKKIIDLIARYFSEEEFKNVKTYVIPMGINTENIKPKIIKDQDEEELNILFVGRFSEKKGVEILIESIYNVKQRLPEKKIKLVLAGDGDQKKIYEKLIKKYNLDLTVEIIGFVDEVRKYELLYRTDLLVVPSVESKDGDIEGLPVVILEGLYCKAIVIASQYTNAQEVINDSEDGFIIKELNSTSLAEKIIHINNLDEKVLNKIKLNAFNKARKYDSINNAKEFFEFLNVS